MKGSVLPGQALLALQTLFVSVKQKKTVPLRTLEQLKTLAGKKVPIKWFWKWRSPGRTAHGHSESGGCKSEGGIASQKTPLWEGLGFLGFTI